MAKTFHIDVRWNAQARHWYVADAAGLDLPLSAPTIPELQLKLSQHLPPQLQESAVLTVTDLTDVGGRN